MTMFKVIAKDYKKAADDLENLASRGNVQIGDAGYSQTHQAIGILRGVYGNLMRQPSAMGRAVMPPEAD